MLRWMIAILLIATAAAWCRADEPPGSIVLLEGYRHKTEQGIDSRVGRIWKDGGLEISYDIGGLAGEYANTIEAGQILWKRQQRLHGRNAVLVMNRENRLFVTFAGTDDHPPANFFASIGSTQDLADMLLMVLTYPAPASQAK